MRSVLAGLTFATLMAALPTMAQNAPDFTPIAYHMRMPSAHIRHPRLDHIDRPRERNPRRPRTHNNWPTFAPRQR